MKLRVELKNIKLIKDLSVEFTGGNLYLIRGRNNVGKTTLIDGVVALLDGSATKKMISNREKDGEITGNIIGADGDPYKITVKLKDDKNPAYTIITPELKKSTKKGDLAKIFDYQHMTVDTFFALGLTEPGRRKQAELVLNMMPQEVQDTISLIDKSYKKTYDERHNVHVQLDYMKEQIPPKPDAKTIAAVAKLDTWEKQQEQSKDRLAEIKRTNGEVTIFNNNIDNRKKSLDRNISEWEEEIKRIQHKIEMAKAERESLVPKERTHTDEQIRDIEEKLQRNANFIASVKAQKSLVEKYNDLSEKIKTKEENYKKYTNDIEEMKAEKRKLLSENLSVPHLDIRDGMLVYIDEDDAFPINEKMLSFSRGVIILTGIMYEINKNYPIITLGKARELDSTTLTELSEFAKATDSAILAEYVTDDMDNLEFEIYEKPEEKWKEKQD